MKENILQKIAATKLLEVKAAKAAIDLEMMRRLAFGCRRSVLSMKDAILSGSGIIAEHKRRSPSKGEISPMSDVGQTARIYSEGGASAMSVLTDTRYFGGALTDLALARIAVPELPLLRKDFILDPYQLYEARVAGADAVLLIAAMLSPDEMKRLNDEAHALGLQTLVEVHCAEEAAEVPEDADMVGINNRDLASFSTDISISASLIGLLPQKAVKIAESGIKSSSDVRKMREAGFNGFLIGEALMSSPDIADTLNSLIV